MTERDEPGQPFLSEFRRVIRLRWLFGGAVVVVTLGNALGSEWAPLHVRVIAVAVAVLAYNAVFAVVARRGNTPRGLLVWGQLLPDLAALTLLAVWTGGAASPMLLAFFLYMLVVSLVLTPATAYSAAGVGIGMVICGLGLADGWPDDRRSIVMLLGWALSLLLTAYLTNRIARGARSRESELQRQSRRTQAILDTAAEGIITIDDRGVVQSINPAAERMFGYAARDVVGHNVSMLMPEPYRGEHDRYLANYLATGEARIIGIGREVVGRRHDGELFPVDLAVSEVVTDNGRLFTGIVRDVTERKRAEAELKALNDTLLRQQEAMVQHEKMVAMGEMAAGVAHEIANPLASMDSLLQLVSRHPERFGPETIATLRGQIARIEQLVRRMKAFAHPGDAVWETVEVNRLVTNALEMIRFDQRTRRVEIQRDLAPEAGRVHVIPHTVEQVVVNLVLNALDAVVGEPDPQVTVSTRPEPGGAVIRVVDNGAGIEPAHLSRIFEPFFTTKPVGQGTGLGLSISFSLVERNHGRFETRSRPGEGAVFSVHLKGAAPSASEEG